MARTSATAFWTSGGSAMGTVWAGICSAGRVNRQLSMVCSV
jgi:hypothetical protein